MKKRVESLVKWALRGRTERDGVIKNQLALMPYTCD